MANYIKRLTKEAKQLSKDPTPMCLAAPLEDDILEWRYVIKGEPDSPHAGGVFMGRLIFSEKYPFEAPHIQIITPNGRWETCTDLCLSISHYHPESWSPSWTVGTVLLGISSFMYQLDGHSMSSIGAIRASDDDKKKFAGESIAFNKKDKEFIDLFGADGDAAELFAEAEATMESLRPSGKKEVATTTTTTTTADFSEKEKGKELTETAAGTATVVLEESVAPKPVVVSSGGRRKKGGSKGLSGILAAAGLDANEITEKAEKEKEPSTVFSEMALEGK